MIKKIQIIIGQAVLGSGSTDIIKMGKLINYLNGQMKLIRKDVDDETKGYIDSVLKTGESFLDGVPVSDDNSKIEHYGDVEMWEINAFIAINSGINIVNISTSLNEGGYLRHHLYYKRNII